MIALDPFGPPDAARLFFSTNQEAIRVSAFLCFISAIPLVLYTALIVAQLEFVVARHAGAYVAFAGGIAASAGLAAAGMFLWLLSVPEITTSLPVVRALHFLVFLSGGAAFAVGMGLLSAGISVSSRIEHLLPAWIVRLGLVLAATGALAAFGLLSVPMTVAIPITRVGGFLWLIATGAIIPGARHYH
jgi:hypothetical protein